MSAAGIRLKKEARALVWPWCAVVAGGISPAVLPHAYAEAVNALTVTAGISLLCALPLGNEFENRTFGLWLSQPQDRLRQWGEKTAVMFAAVLTAALACAMGIFQFTWRQEDAGGLFWFAIYVAVTACGATYWTLVARSTIGGMFVNFCFQSLIFWSAVGVTARTLDLPRAIEHLETTFGKTTLGASAGLYALLMLWLGARKLAHFQLKGEGVGDDLQMAGPSFLPEAWARSLRCRPTGAVVNLIRKEVRTLRPLWLLSSLAVLYIIVMAVLRLLPETDAPAVAEGVTVQVVRGSMILLFMLLAILAGSLSMGEERTWGTQSWQMTLPVAVRELWLVKLSVALLSGLVCAFVIPVVVLRAVGFLAGLPVRNLFVPSLPFWDAVRASSGASLTYMLVPSLPFWALAVLFVSLASFWCGCLTKRTSYAAILFFPVVWGLALAGGCGLWLGQEFTSKLGTVCDLVVSWFHLNPWASLRATMYMNQPWFYLAIFFLPALLAGMLQSYRLFRTPPESGIAWFTRNLLPLAVISLLCSFLVSAGFLFSRWSPVWETYRALEKLEPGAEKVELSGDDLGRSAAVSSLTRRWLAGATIAVSPGNSRAVAYRATIHLSSGVDCLLTIAPRPGVGLNLAAGSCSDRKP